MTPSAWMPDSWAKTLVPTMLFQAGMVRAEAAATVRKFQRPRLEKSWCATQDKTANACIGEIAL